MSHSKRRNSLIPNPNVTDQLISSWPLAEVESSNSQNILQSNAWNQSHWNCVEDHINLQNVPQIGFAFK